jgi:hypothetical protein
MSKRFQAISACCNFGISTRLARVFLQQVPSLFPTIDSTGRTSRNRQPILDRNEDNAYDTLEALEAGGRVLFENEELVHLKHLLSV